MEPDSCIHHLPQSITEVLVAMLNTSRSKLLFKLPKNCTTKVKPQSHFVDFFCKDNKWGQSNFYFDFNYTYVLYVHTRLNKLDCSCIKY